MTSETALGNQWPDQRDDADQQGREGGRREEEAGRIQGRGSMTALPKSRTSSEPSLQCRSRGSWEAQAGRIFLHAGIDGV